MKRQPKEPSGHEEESASTRVVIEFNDAAPGKTRLRLTHSGWREGEEWQKVRAYFDRVWPLVLAELEKRFTSGPRQWPTQ